MTVSSSLSPVAESVMDAYWTTPSNGPVTTQIHQAAVAAALRAAADQVVPDEFVPGWTQLGNDNARRQRQQTRAELLAIADELEGAS